MKVLLLGAGGAMGPHVVRELGKDHSLRVTDIRPLPASFRKQWLGHEFLEVDIASADQVRRACEGMDAVINLAVVRTDRRLAFGVNLLGCYHVLSAAVACGIRRVINTGPHFAVAGPDYESYDHQISPDAPPHPGTGLYALTKSLGQEVCRQFAQEHDVYVQEYLFYWLVEKGELRQPKGGVPFVISWEDAARVFRLGLEIDLARLPSRCETFFLLADAPQGRFRNDKAMSVLGFRPRDAADSLWRITPP